jgi:sugar O-acyltransferase (sialic acid O-acetyltransferase NeuD family)
MNTESTARSSGGDLVIIGAGGFARETAQAIEALNRNGAGWRLLGYLDDDPARHGEAIDGTVVLGGRDQIEHLPGASLVVCTGRPSDYVSRPRIVGELGLPQERYATIIHPSCAVSISSSIGPGSVLLAHVALTTAVQVGAHVMIMPHVTLTHDDAVDDYATLASGARLGGGVRIQKGAYVGAGAIVGEGHTVGKFSLVGMGAVVTRDIPPCEVWAGVPARRLRAADVPNESTVAEILDDR